MKTQKPCIGILTSGGDCPGLNAVIRATVLSSERLGYSCIGFLRGYEGLVDPVEYMPLTPANTSGILTQGGTILGSTNRGRFSATTGKDNRLAIDPDLLTVVAQTVRQLGDLFNRKIVQFVGRAVGSCNVKNIDLFRNQSCRSELLGLFRQLLFDLALYQLAFKNFFLIHNSDYGVLWAVAGTYEYGQI